MNGLLSAVEVPTIVQNVFAYIPYAAKCRPETSWPPYEGGVQSAAKFAPRGGPAFGGHHSNEWYQGNEGNHVDKVRCQVGKRGEFHFLNPTYAGASGSACCHSRRSSKVAFREINSSGIIFRQILHQSIRGDHSGRPLK